MAHQLKIVAIIQARLASTRFPNKVLAQIGNTTAVRLLLDRLSASQMVDYSVIATSVSKTDDELCKYLDSIKANYFRGDEKNVLDRYFKAACFYSADVIVRICGDSPFIDAGLIDRTIDQYIQRGADYASNVNPPTFPDGLDVEVFSFDILKAASKNATENFDLEHVTPFIKKTARSKVNLTSDIDMSSVRLTLDDRKDLSLIKDIYEHFYPNNHFNHLEIKRYLDANPHLLLINGTNIRNEGANMSNGQKLWKRAQEVIPGGNMQISKRAEMHLQDGWPNYFMRTRGCKIWDLDENEYFDTYYMGLGTNILGYSHPVIDEAVIKAVKAGNMSTLNAPEEVQLAEKLLEINPWSDKVMFARTGGEANAIAIRLARAASNKQCVALCGYHGWHDWYLSANLGGKDRLSDHLIPGLGARGIPKSTEDIVHAFKYNDLEGLRSLINEFDVGVVIMEVTRNILPNSVFLSEVKNLCRKSGIVLIFDECTSGFRETFGGLHLKYNVTPDIAVYGKALGNGYAISAIVGIEEVMDEALKTFISSTFWTERIGFVAGVKTLAIMEETRSWEKITSIGKSVKKIWRDISKKHDVKLDISGIDAMPGFKFLGESAQQYKTLLTQEMLKNGFLAGSSFYACIAHNEDVLDRYKLKLDQVFELIANCENGYDVEKLLKGTISKNGISRLN